ncbi:hypothetical protein [Marinilactibacillus psychrotolerans]|uniref:hypothetical protein n=1 Tax=Marinilactibacillus psychrotolerans TaxID=191770 RepID=UPI00388BB98D
MKKYKKCCCFNGCYTYVSGAQGTWSSSWGYDVNRASKIGATSAMESSYWYQFQVHGAGNVVLSHSIKQLSAHQSYSTTHYSAPLQQKQGRISASPQVHFTPIFNH